MKGKSIKSKFIGFSVVAIAFAAAICLVSYLVIHQMGAVAGSAPDALMIPYFVTLAAIWAAFIISEIMIVNNMLKMLAPIKMATDQAMNISRGEALVRSRHDEDNELGDLAVSINAVLDYIIGRVELLDRINEGEYSMQVEPLGDTDKLTMAIIRVLKTNNEVLYAIKNAALSVNSAAGEIASGANSLASGSAEQAATMEEFSAVMAEVLAMADKSAEIAKSTLKNALDSKVLMEESSEAIGRITDAMDSITASGRRIETITKVIDDIAFQTNILSLNAAIEAARAGQHGKGFAVVADEVRLLASKSAAAARETSELVQASIQSVEEGNGIVRRTAGSLLSMTRNASNAAEEMGTLAGSSEHQRQAISEINNGINQLSTVIQANSAVAQQNLVNAQELSLQSQSLKDLVARFRLRDDEENML